MAAAGDAGGHLCPHTEGAYLVVKLTQRKIEPEDEEREGQGFMALHLALLKSISPIEGPFPSINKHSLA